MSLSYFPIALPSLGFLPSPAPRRAIAAKPERVVAIGDIAGVYSSVWAMPAGHVAALLETLPNLVGCRPAEARMMLGLSPQAAAGQSKTSGGSIAIISISGTIFPRGSLADLLGLATPGRLAAHVRELVSRPDVATIVLDVDSPGGTVQGIDELTTELFKARAKKKLVAVSNYKAASAAYWIASAAHEFVVSPSSEIGSIGVFAAHEDISRALDQAGLKITLVSAGRYKTEGNPWEPLTEDGRADIQKQVDNYYSMFVGAVARNRGVTEKQVRNGFGEGRMVGARDAVKLGMADRVATLDETVARLSRPSAGQAHQAQASLHSNLDFRRRRMRLHEKTMDRAGSTHRELSGDEVFAVDAQDAQIVAQARRALAYCERDLGLVTSPELHWFAADTHRYTLGFFLRAENEIWLSDKLTATQVGPTVAHEARHAWQDQTLADDDFRMGDAPAAHQWRESDCETYVARARRAGL